MAREFDRRLDSQDNKEAIRAGSWTLSTEPNTETLIACHADGGCVPVVEKPPAGQAPDDVVDPVSLSPWVKAELTASFDHNGDSQGEVMYRLVEDFFGDRVLMLKGAAAVLNNTTPTIFTLPQDLIPAADRVYAVPRNPTHSEVAHIRVSTSGTVDLQAAQVTADYSGSLSLPFSATTSTHSENLQHYHANGTNAQGNTSGVVGAPGGGFYDGGDSATAVQHNHTVSGNATGGNHVHNVSYPTWVGLNGIVIHL